MSLQRTNNKLPTKQTQLTLFPFCFPDKDIRAQIHAASDSSYSTHLVNCDASRLLLHQQQQIQQQHQRNNEAAFYQIESPPCYTIATGLPSYDEALHHQPRHFAYGMKFVYPTLAAVHHHHHHPFPRPAAAACVTNWEKDEMHQQQQQQQHQELNKLQKCKLSAPEEDKGPSCDLAAATPAICINMPNGRGDEVDVDGDGDANADAARMASPPTQSLQPAAAADDDCASLVVVVAA